MTTATAGLGGQIRRGLAWSTVNNLLLRMGSLALGILLARLLSPEQFGVYAIALAVQAVLMTLADMGLSADLIRCEDPRRRAPTVAALGLVTGSTLAVVMALTAHQVATLLGSPGAGNVTALLALTLVLAGAGVVPYAMLQREFQQKKLFAIAMVDFTISTVVTITLVAAGWGVISLAIGRIVAQCVTLVLQFRLAGVRPRYALDRSQVRPVVAFGLPVAGANMLSWALLNIDNVVISRVAGPVSLGYYVLAFNISNWPMAAIGQVVRSVALPAFARSRGAERDRSLATGLAITWAVALPAGLMLAVLSVPLVAFVYGAVWAPSAGVLAALGLFGALRVAFDLFASFLLARGASGAVLWIQGLWFVALIPAMVIGTRLFGINGGGWAHLGIGLAIVLPAYLYAARRTGVDLKALAAVVWPPLAAGIPAWLAAHLVAGLVQTPVLALVLGGTAGTGVYAVLIFRWLRRAVRRTTLGIPGSADQPLRATDLVTGSVTTINSEPEGSRP
jgi:lipopolysaccharide exporter